MNKALLLLALAFLVALAGCVPDFGKASLEEKVRAIPVVREAIDSVPDAEVVIALWDEDTVSAVKKELDAECKKEMPVKYYYRVEAKNASKALVLYLDSTTEEVECRHEKGAEKPVEGPDYVPPGDEKPPAPRPVETKKLFLEVVDEDGQLVREVPVRVEKLVCDLKDQCIPRTVVDAKTDLVGRIRDLDAGVFSNSTLFAEGFHSFKSDDFRKLSGGYRAIAKRVVREKDLLPLKVRFFDEATGGNFVGGVLYLKFEENETGLYKEISPEGEVEVTLDDFSRADRRYVDEFGNLLFKQLIFEVEGIEEKGVVYALLKPLFVETRENTYGPFETQTTRKEWDLRQREIILRLHETIPVDAQGTVYEFNFKAGKNYVSLPLKVPENYSAEAFLIDVSRQGLSCDKVSVYEIQDWHTHSKGSIARNFLMENGVAYNVECSAAGTYKLKGEHLYEPLGINLNLGFNYVGTSARIEGKPVGSLVEGCDVKSIQKFFPNGLTGTIPSSTPAVLGEVYLVVCEVGGTWDKKV